ncbi:MAG TPA: AMP-binding protein [Acidimicrobiia bacterium]|nr:AMP-binding protein [Acidimicrobiia bacterium]
MTSTLERSRPGAQWLGVKSIPELLRSIAREEPDKVALREKEFGIWQETTYAGYWDLVQAAAMGMWTLGIRPGDKVAIQSENRIAWVVSDIAAQSIQAASVGLYPTNPSAEVEYLLGHSEAKILIAEDQEQVDKALEVKDRLPNLAKIIYVEPRGVRSYEDPMLMSWEDFLGIGRAALAESPGRVDELVDAIDPDDVGTLVYTSGTTGPPKGAMLSHNNMVWVSESGRRLIAGDSVPSSVQYLSYLPLCHVFGRLYDLAGALAMRATVNFAESIETVVSDLGEIQPTYFPAPPRIWEKMHASVQIRMADASVAKKVLYKIFLGAGMRNADRMLERGSRGLWGGLLHLVGNALVYRSLKKKLGMQRCRQAISGSAPIAPEVLKFFMALGIPIFEGWGMTETTAVGTVNSLGDMKLGTIGKPIDDVEIELADDGEILVRSPGIFKGYFKNPEATAETIEPDGWMHTGDVAEWTEDGFLRIVDRKKDIIITAGGKNISPSEIENKLKVSPFVKEAMVIGDRRKFLSALIGIEFDTVANWAQRKNITFTTYRDLSEKPEVVGLIQKAVDEANQHFARVETIKKFALIPKELDHEEGELTATQKIKRRVLADQFSDMIEEMYA